jgi:hypothetical protein
MNKVVYILCFRDTPGQGRAHQLTAITSTLSSLCKSFNVECNLIVSEHCEDGTMFNRSACLNAGALKALELLADILILHDVDLIPSRDHFAKAYVPLYTSMRANEIVHLGSAWTKYRYPTFLGGALAVPLCLFWQVGGMPLSFFGWGGEDDAFYNRLEKLPRWSWSLVRFDKDERAYNDLDVQGSQSFEFKRTTPRHLWMNPDKKALIALDKARDIEWNRDIAMLRECIAWTRGRVLQANVEWASFTLEASLTERVKASLSNAHHRLE